MNRKQTPAEQVQEALTLIGRLFVQEQDTVTHAQGVLDSTAQTLYERTKALNDEQRITRALRADLDGTMVTLNKQTEECNELREKAFRLQVQNDKLVQQLKDAEMRDYEQERQIEELNPTAYERELVAVCEERDMYRRAYNLLVDTIVERSTAAKDI